MEIAVASGAIQEMQHWLAHGSPWQSSLLSADWAIIDLAECVWMACRTSRATSKVLSQVCAATLCPSYHLNCQQSVPRRHAKPPGIGRCHLTVLLRYEDWEENPHGQLVRLH